MATNKVVYGNNTLIDLTNDSVTPESLLEGATAHDRSGAQITGSLRNLGHTILSKLGTPMNARANLSFGNANVTDDATNDVTKVDIQNIEPITQEAYNQLTQAEKNAHPWFITNATSFGGVYLFQTVALMEAAVQAGTVPAGAVMMTGVDTPYVPEAEDVNYDNTESGLSATDLQGAVDELNGNVSKLFIPSVSAITTFTSRCSTTEPQNNRFIDCGAFIVVTLTALTVVDTGVSAEILSLPNNARSVGRISYQNPDGSIIYLDEGWNEIQMYGNSTRVDVSLVIPVYY